MATQSDRTETALQAHKGLTTEQCVLLLRAGADVKAGFDLGDSSQAATQIFANAQTPTAAVQATGANPGLGNAIDARGGGGTCGTNAFGSDVGISQTVQGDRRLGGYSANDRHSGQSN